MSKEVGFVTKNWHNNREIEFLEFFFGFFKMVLRIDQKAEKVVQKLGVCDFLDLDFRCK